MENNNFFEEYNRWNKVLVLADCASSIIVNKLEVFRKIKKVTDVDPIEHIKTRVKSLESINEKLQRKGFNVSLDNAIEYINDIAGVRVICLYIKDMYEIMDYIGKQDDIEIIKIKDYVSHPKKNGYKSIHLIVEVPIYIEEEIKKMKVEIQIRTVGMDYFASIEHRVIYKTSQNQNISLETELKECSEFIEALDNRITKIDDLIQELEQSEE